MGVFMKSKFIAMVLTAIGLASFSLSSCTSSTPKEEDYYEEDILNKYNFRRTATNINYGI